MLAIERLRELLAYDPATGVLTWKQSRGRVKAGTAAGSIGDRGYVVICVERHRLRAHRIAWAITTGAWPEDEIDHKDNVRSNNRWDNLRPATGQQNKFNRVVSKFSHTGVKGVHFRKATGRYMAHLAIDGKLLREWFSTQEEAAARRDEWAKQYHGEFAR